MQPTIVLVHGAFAESASWDRVIDPLVAKGHRVIAAANPLRGVAADAAAVSDLLRTTDLYIAPDSFNDIFCQDVPAAQAALMAATQRPATQEALVEPSGDHPLWKDVPSWFLIGEEDRIIPPELQRYMAHRAGSQRTVAVEGASHAISVSRPDATVHPILEAAALRAVA